MVNLVKFTQGILVGLAFLIVFFTVVTVIGLKDKLDQLELRVKALEQSKS